MEETVAAVSFFCLFSGRRRVRAERSSFRPGRGAKCSSKKIRSDSKDENMFEKGIDKILEKNIII